MPDEAKFKPQKDINRLKSQVKKLEKDKEKLFPELGRATYRVFLGGGLSEPSLVETCGQLKSLDGQIEQAGVEIGRLQQQAQLMKAAPAAPPAAATFSCPYCNAPLTAGTRFCGNCGKGLSAPAAQPPALCTACGQPLSPGLRFCGECGKPVGASVPQAPPPAPAPVQKASAPAATPPPVPPPPPAAPSAGEEGAPAAPPASPAVARRCTACGAPAEEGDAAFCGECGARLA